MSAQNALLCIVQNSTKQFRQTRIPLERASQEEQNGTYFSFVAPSSECRKVTGKILSKRLTIVHGFRPETEIFVIANYTFSPRCVF